MRFAFLLPDGFDPRGGVRRVMDYAELLGQRGHECIVVSGDASIPPWLNSDKYRHFRLRCTSSPYYSVTCDVAWATGKRGGLRLRKMRRAKLKIFSVVMLESLNRPTHRADRADRMLADPYGQNWLYVANSSWLRDAVRARGQRCEMVLAAPRADIFRPDAPPADKGRHSVVMCLQSRGQWKGSERSVAAINYAKSKWTRRNKIETRIFGPGKRPDFSRPLRKLGVVAVHELPAQYAAADVVLHSSAFEGWANVPFEAMCCGTPFVAFDTPGLQDFAVDGFNCRIVPPFDTDAMGEAMLEVLLDSGLRERLRRGCIETYKRFCMIDTVADIERVAANGLARAAEAMK